MSNLKEAVDRAIRRKRPVLVLGPDRVPSELSKTIAEMANPLKVTSCDCREAVPAQADLNRLLSTGLKNEGIVHVMIDRKLDPRLYDTLVSVISDGRVPGADADEAMSGVVILSSSARWSSELAAGLNEYFPIQVGAAE